MADPAHATDAAHAALQSPRDVPVRGRLHGLRARMYPFERSVIDVNGRNR